MMFADLLLFDIDGTLVRRSGPFHRLALIHGVRHATGVDTTTDGLPVQGMLDQDIVRHMLQRQGFDAGRIASLMPAIIQAAEDEYLATCPDIREKCCPGAADLLQKLHDSGIPMALVTGNFTRIGWRKLERAGLRHFFRFGAFAEMAPTRGNLAALAIERARRENLMGPNARIALVGDAPQDIQAARENGIVSIAVKTGVTPPGDLEALAPDHLLEDLTHWPATLGLL